MTPKREVLDYLTDIVDAIDAALSFVGGMDSDQFRVDLRTVYAVTHALEIVGEAAKRIPDPVRIHYSVVPWRLMAGMRDRLILWLRYCRSRCTLEDRHRRSADHTPADRRSHPAGAGGC
jgi:uncharacterized protein with HEPN domain